MMERLREELSLAERSIYWILKRGRLEAKSAVPGSTVFQNRRQSRSFRTEPV